MPIKNGETMYKCPLCSRRMKLKSKYEHHRKHCRLPHIEKKLEDILTILSCRAFVDQPSVPYRQQPIEVSLILEHQAKPRH